MPRYAHERRLLRRLAFVCCTLVLCPAAALAQASAPPVSPSADTVPDYDAIIQQIQTIANVTANSRAYFDEDLRPIHIDVTVSAEDRIVYFDMGERFGHEAGFDELADLRHQVESDTEQLRSQLPDVEATKWRFGGHDTSWWLDREYPTKPLPTNTRQKRSDDSSANSGPLVVAGGHGYYYHRGYKMWTTHRSRVDGVVEDEITQQLTDALQVQLGARGIQSVNLRRVQDRDTHMESGHAWWKLGARYHIEAKYPQLTDIWNHDATRAVPDLERRQDILSRPLFANHTRAQALINVHTNADTSSTATGTRVFYYPGRTEDEHLGSLILCSMSEVIHAAEPFADFSVPLKPSPSDAHAETKKATMPSVIVEVGFHTNPSDLKLLTNYDFRQASMRGVAKGYKLYASGKTCEPFRIAEDKAGEATLWKKAKLPVDISGNPDYPIMVEQTRTDCEGCKPFRQKIWAESQRDEYRVEHECNPASVEKSTIAYRVRLIDAAGVTSNTANYTFTCKPRVSRRR